MEKETYLDLLANHKIGNAHPGGFQLTRTLLRREKITPDTMLLDVGCGTGQTSAFLARHHPCHVVAVDINSKMVERAQQTFAKAGLDIPLYRANAMDLPFRKNTFDIVLSESVLTFTQIRRALWEFYRVLKPGGVLLAVEATAGQPFSEAELEELQAVVGISSLPTREEWCQAFQKTGFSKVEVLYHKKTNWVEPSPFFDMSGAFSEYLNTVSRHRKKLGYAVFRCQA